MLALECARPLLPLLLPLPLLAAAMTPELLAAAARSGQSVLTLTTLSPRLRGTTTGCRPAGPLRPESDPGGVVDPPELMALLCGASNGGEALRALWLFGGVSSLRRRSALPVGLCDAARPTGAGGE